MRGTGTSLRGAFVAAFAIAAISAVLTAGPAAAFKPNVGKYTATVPGTVTTNSLTMEVVRRSKRTMVTRVLRVADDCAASFFQTPFGLGRLFAKDFKYQGAGVNNSASYSIDIDGLFTNATTGTARVKSKATQNLPPPGMPPATCSDDTTFTLKFAGGPKPRKKKG